MEAKQPMPEREEVILQHLEKNPVMVTENGGLAVLKRRHTTLWENLGFELNSYELDNKSARQWQMVHLSMFVSVKRLQFRSCAGTSDRSFFHQRTCFWCFTFYRLSFDVLGTFRIIRRFFNCRYIFLFLSLAIARAKSWYL